MSQVETLPRKWRGAYVDVRTLTDEERHRRKLSSNRTITELVGGGRNLVHEIQQICDYARRKKVVTMDTETTGLNFYSDKIILLQVGDEERQYLLWWQTLSQEEKDLILDLWSSPEVKKVGVNLKFDGNMILGNEGMHRRGDGLLDCQLIDQILNCGLTGDVGLTMKLTGMGSMALRYLGLKLVKDEDIRTGWGEMTPGKWWKTKDEVAAEMLSANPQVSEEEIEQAYEIQREEGQTKRYYAADDVCVPIKLLQWQMPWVRKLGLVPTVKLEMQVLPELIDSEMRGVPLDWDRWTALAREAEFRFAQAEEELDKIFDVTITYREDLDGNVTIERDKNYGSTDQLKQLIHEYMLQEHGVTVICTNGQFKEALAKSGMNPTRLEKLFEQKLVPNPEEPDKNKKVGYPNMDDYVVGNKELGVESRWEDYQSRLPGGSFRLTDTDSKTLKLMRILHETADYRIDAHMPTKIGLPPELVDPILDFREYKTKLERYAWGWKDLINPGTGRVHTDYTQVATDTGRYSTRPNLQNLPRDQRYRDCFRARPGYKIVAADYSQIEPRLIAEYSLDPTYMRVFWSGYPGTEGFRFWCGDYEGDELDLYAAIGEMVGLLEKGIVTKALCKLTEAGSKGRQYAKVIVLGLGYGTGPDKFQIMMILDTGEYHPKEYTDQLFNTFWQGAEKVKETLNELSALADPKKSKRKVWHPFVEAKITYSETLNGRKRFYRSDTKAWWTQSRNFPIQGGGADILKLARVGIGNYVRANGIDGGILVDVHDEILMEVREDQAEQMAKAMSHIMVKAGQKWVKKTPISADPTITAMWWKD